MIRRLRWVLLGTLGVALVAAGVLFGPDLLRRMSVFQVRAVEISGVHMLTPAEVLQASGIRSGQSVWDDPATWERALESHPVIASARVMRRFPATLRVQVEEERPVAYVDDGGLAPVPASGERLPVDPTRAPADLPIARGAAGKTIPRRLLEEADRLQQLDPGLLSGVSEIRARDAEGRTLLLRHRKADVVVAAGAPANRLVELRAVLADLERRMAVADAGGVAHVDLRFEEQVVVRLPTSVQMP